MDNFRIDIVSEGKENLQKAFSLLPHNKVIGYRVDAKKGLVLYWAESDKLVRLPFPMSLEQAADFVYGWLAHVDYGDEPDHDGDNGKGWQIYNEEWGHVDHDWQAFVAIKPVWAMYGK